MKGILVIEDSMELKENTAELLQLANFRVLTAHNGAEGYFLARTQHPHLILCDMLMPSTNGWGFLQLAQADPATAAIPIIFFSAGCLFPDRSKQLALKVKGYLSKPFTEQELFDAIETGLKA